MRKKKLLEDLYGYDLYSDHQANRLVEAMHILGERDRRHYRNLKALQFRYGGSFQSPLLTWKVVGERVGHFQTGKSISGERVRQMAAVAMRWLHHPKRRKYILQGLDGGNWQ